MSSKSSTDLGGELQPTHEPAPWRQAVAERAAWLIREEGLDFGTAKRKAARQLGGDRRSALPDAQDIDAALLRLADEGCDDPQADAVLQALRHAALQMMRRLAQHRPHLSGTVWRGTAGRHSAIDIELYTDDDKRVEIDLANAGLRYDVEPPAPGRSGHRARTVLLLDEPAPAPLGIARVRLTVLPAQAERGALRETINGLTKRGNLEQVERLQTESARVGGAG